MFDKVWRRLTERLGGRPQSRLRFAVHRHPSYPSSWQPVEGPGESRRIEIQIYLEASNMAAVGYWIVAAELAGVSAVTTVIGVRDARTGTFSPDNPLPPGRLATLSLHFVVDGGAGSVDEPIRLPLILTDHLGERHGVDVVMH